MKIPGALLLLLLFSSAASATPLDGLSLVYETNFDDGTLNPSIDTLGIGPLLIGDTLIPGSNPTGMVEDGGLTLDITRPSGAVGPVGVAGVALASFGQDSIVALRAVYALPVGPHDPSQTWAAGLVVRTYFLSDLPDSQRAAATFQIIGNAARLNTPGASTPAGLPNIPQNVYDAIFSPTDPATFTLELVVDRITGTGYASLSSDGYEISRSNYAFSIFGPDFGPDITALGPSLALNGGTDISASLRVLDFQIFTQAIPEAPAWIVFAAGLFLVGAGKFRAARPRDCALVDVC